MTRSDAEACNSLIWRAGQGDSRVFDSHHPLQIFRSLRPTASADRHPVLRVEPHPVAGLDAKRIGIWSLDRYHACDLAQNTRKRTLTELGGRAESGR